MAAGVTAAELRRAELEEMRRVHAVYVAEQVAARHPDGEATDHPIVVARVAAVRGSGA